MSTIAPDARVETAPPPHTPGFWWRVLMPLVAVAAGMVGLIAAAVAALAFTSHNMADAIATSLGSGIILAVGLALVRHLPRHERRRIFALKAPVPTTVAMGLAAGLGGVVASAIVIGAGTAIDSGVRHRTQGISSPFGSGAAAITLVVFGVVVLAPLGEELLFRGIMLRGLVRRIPFWPAAVVSAMVFGACHPDVWFYLFWPRWLALAVVGVGLAWLNRERGYWCGVTAHATINGLATLATLLVG
jgi:membrane protease YdiL (CAAX protease family)